MDISKKTYTYEQIIEKIENVAYEILLNNDVMHNKIVTLAKGGLFPSRIISKILGVDEIYTIGMKFYNKDNQRAPVPLVYQSLTNNFDEADKILVVDDIIDSGYSIKKAIEIVEEHNGMTYDICSVFLKPHSKIYPKYHSEEVSNETWIEFPWE